jgi:predicted PurR-regulated permease PerM
VAEHKRPGLPEQHAAELPLIASARHQGPRSWAGDTLALLQIVTRVFGSYTRGVLVESIIVGIITGLAYFLIGVEAWLPLAAIALVGEIVPIIGPWVAFFLSLPVILATQPDKAVLALGLFVAIQILDGWLLAPRIRGGSLHFRSVPSLIVLVVGGAVAGPPGVILALPAAALLRDISLYTSYRAKGLSPAAALSKLPTFQPEQVRKLPVREEAALLTP